MTRKLTIIESPFAANSPAQFGANLQYLRECLRDSWERGELPFASHGFFPFFLNESDPKERREGIEAGYEFWHFHHIQDDDVPKIIFYTDLGISDGMVLAFERAKTLGREYEMRCIHSTMGGK